jgi:hypothetical protein
MNANCYYDERCIPMWLNSMYLIDVLTPYEYLTLYPLDAQFKNKFVMEKLLHQIRPYENTINEKINYILHLHKELHRDPLIRPVISST